MSGIDGPPKPRSENGSIQLREEVRRTMAEFVEASIGRAFSHYPKVENQRDLLPHALDEIIAMRPRNLRTLNRMLDYAADLDQTYVFSCCAGAMNDDATCRALHDHIIDVLQTGPVDYSSPEEMRQFLRLTQFVLESQWDSREQGPGFFEKASRLMKYRTTNTSSILEALSPRERVEFVRSQLKKRK